MYTFIPNLSPWMRSQRSLSLWKRRLCDWKSEREWRASGWGDTSPHCRFMVVYVSEDSPGDRERQADSLAERPRFEPDLFLFFPRPHLSLHPPPPIYLYHHHHHHLFLSCHMLKVEPVEVNDKQTTQGGWCGESEEWVVGWRWGHWKGGVWHKGEPVTLT